MWGPAIDFVSSLIDSIPAGLWQVIVVCILAFAATRAVRAWKNPDLIKAEAEKRRIEAETTNVTHDDAGVIYDWIEELDDRIERLESQPADIAARLRYHADDEGRPVFSAKLCLSLRNRSKHATVDELDVRVIERDGQACRVVRVTSAHSVTLEPGQSRLLDWPDAAGVAGMYLLKLNWKEAGTLMDEEVPLWHPSA
ncbi:MAG: hypothetical protein WD250_03160 [Egibacteraceae bacterium]